MDRANLALAEYLLELKAPVYMVAHEVEASLAKHPLAHVRIVPRTAGSYMLAEIPLGFHGRRTARRVLRQWPQAQVVVNGGNCIWPGINWVHCVHQAWPAPPAGSAPWLFRIKGASARSLDRRKERRAFRCARLLITNSERTSRDVRASAGVDPSRVHTVYLGADPDWASVTCAERAASRQSMEIPESRTVASFVGALGYDHNKGFDKLFRAWEELCARPDWDVDLLAAGSGPALPMWQNRVHQAGLGGRIRLLGFSEQVKSLLAASDVLVSPVRYEAYGLNVHEAICLGIPAMVSRSAGIAERYPSDLRPMLIPDPEDVGDLVGRLLDWRARKEDWKVRFAPFADRLRSRSWRDMAVDIVSFASQKGV